MEPCRKQKRMAETYLNQSFLSESEPAQNNKTFWS